MSSILAGHEAKPETCAKTNSFLTNSLNVSAGTATLFLFALMHLRSDCPLEPELSALAVVGLCDFAFVAIGSNG